MAEQDQQRVPAVPVHERNLPPLAPAGASDDERNRAIMARMVARFGAPSLADYRRTYAAAGLEWPGDDEVRRRHIVADQPGDPAPSAS